MQEIIIVIFIIGVLATVGIGFGAKQITKANVSSVGSKLRIVASDVESAIVDLGFLQDVDDTDAVTNYYKSWTNNYLTCVLDLDSLEFVAAGNEFGTDFEGTKIQTTGYEDPWGNEVKIMYLVPVSDKLPRIIIASGGPNGKFAADAANGYINEGFDDDIVMVMEPRR